MLPYILHILASLAFLLISYSLWLFLHLSRQLRAKTRELAEANAAHQQTYLRLEDMSRNFFSLAESYSSLATAHNESLTNEKASMARTRKVLELGEHLLSSVSQTLDAGQSTNIAMAYRRDPSLVNRN